MESYENEQKPPLIEITDNAFRITLYNTQLSEQVKAKPEAKSKTYELENLLKNELKITKLIEHKKSASRHDIQIHLGIAQATAMNYVKKLQDKGVIIYYL